MIPIGTNLASFIKKWRITFKKRCDFPNPQAVRDVGGKRYTQIVTSSFKVWREKSLFSGNLWKKDLQSTSAAIGTSLSVPTNLPSGIFISLLFQFLSKEITLIRIFAFTEKCHCLLWERELLFACGEINQFNSAEPFYKPCSVGRGKSIERLWILLWQLAYRLLLLQYSFQL